MGASYLVLFSQIFLIFRLTLPNTELPSLTDTILALVLIESCPLDTLNKFLIPCKIDLSDLSIV
jgi:hypothetical protein